MRTLNTIRKAARRTGIVCAAGLLSTVAWAVPPYNYSLPPVDYVGVPLIDCTSFGMNFWVIFDWTANEYGRIHFDQDGNWVAAKGFRFNTNGRAYNSSDPSKELFADDAPGTGVHTHFIARFDENRILETIQQSGVFFQFVLPGYGALAVNAGRVVSVFDGSMWRVIEVTPHAQFPSVEGAYAICSVLQ